MEQKLMANEMNRFISVFFYQYQFILVFFIILYRLCYTVNIYLRDLDANRAGLWLIRATLRLPFPFTFLNTYISCINDSPTKKSDENTEF